MTIVPIKERQEHLAGAFPHCIWYGDSHAGHSIGLTKREYFAGQALQGFFAGVPFDSEIPMTEADDKYLEEVARVCFKMADAMLLQGAK